MRVERVELCEHPTFVQWLYEKAKHWILDHDEMLRFFIHISVISSMVIAYVFMNTLVIDRSLFMLSIQFNICYWGVLGCYRIYSYLRDLYNDYRRDIVIEGRRRSG
jgi:hypothetical protein